MKLIASPTSPYARKVRIALAEKKIEYELVESLAWDARTIRCTHDNPLGKVPVLVLDDGTHALRLARHRRVHRYGEPGVAARFPSLTASASRSSAGKRWPTASATPPWRSCSSRGVRRNSRTGTGSSASARRSTASVAELARRARRQARGATAKRIRWPTSPPDARWATSICAIPTIDWRRAYPNLARLAEKLAKRPSFQETLPPPA